MASDDLVSFGDLLRRARRAAGFTHEELAERSGLSVRGISDLERGVVRSPRRDTLELLVEALDLPAAERQLWDKLRRGLAQRGRTPSETAEVDLLPTPLTSLVGRDQAVGDVAACLASGAGRLVTITGPGGVGKTRLAIEVGHRLRHQFADGIWFVDLAPLSGAESVVPTIASVLGVVVAGKRSPQAALVETLRQSARLLVLDNYEQIVESAPEIARLLIACPHLSILVTSRIALRIQGEREYPLAPLSLPAFDQPINAAEATKIASVALFAQRAQSVRPDFQISDDNIEAVAEICRRLDGLPLALELAAARIRLLPPQAMLERMEQRLPLLVGTIRDAPDRQRTLRATIQWSYDLLGAEDQRLFRSFSLFRGGWTLEAAESVAGRSMDVLSGLQTLIDHSLVRTSEQSDGTARYAMLETVREFGLERLDEHLERGPVEGRFADFYLKLAERAAPELHGPHQAHWIALLARDQSNLSSALQRSRELAHAGDRHAMSVSMRLVSSLWWFGYVNGQFEEYGRQLGSTIEFVNRDATAQRLLSEDEDFALGYAEANFGLGAVQIFGRMDRSDYKQGLDKYKQAMGESLAIYRRLDRPADIVRVLIFIAYAAQNGGYFEEAESYFADGIALGRELDAADGVALGLLGQGEMEWRRGNYPQAVGLLSESLELFATQDDSRGIAASTATLGGALLRQGDLGRAGELLRESLHVRHEIGDLGGLPWNLEHLAELSMAGTPSDDSAARAARLLGAAKGLRDRTGSWIYLADQGDYERLVTSIQHRLSEVAFIAAWESGRMMCLEEAVAYALEPDVAELAAASASSPLSKRERQVLHLVVDGRTNQEIADALFISHHTVANHLTSIMNKLGVDSRTAAATWAVKQALPSRE